jgi:phosphoribosylanthranilate isomerase
LDAPHAIRTGSPSAPFDWRLAQRAAAELNVILAGGLNSGNVVPAVELVRPYAVDVSGGVETQPGRKDHEKLASFIKRIREWDSRTNAGITVSSADGLFLKR